MPRTPVKRKPLPARVTRPKEIATCPTDPVEVTGLEVQAFNRACSEAIYYLDEVADPSKISPIAMRFFAYVFTTRLRYHEDGWLTFDGKKIAHLTDSAPCNPCKQT